MDPDATITILRDETRDLGERGEAAVALRNWFDLGGFPPMGMTRKDARAEAIRFLAAIAPDAEVGKRPPLIVDYLDRIAEAAPGAAIELALRGAVQVALTPGDHTRYKIMVGAGTHRLLPEFDREAGIGAREYWVASQFGKLYPWSGETDLTIDYAAAKYADGHLPTGRVIATFLNALAVEIRKGLNGDVRPQRDR